MLENELRQFTGSETIYKHWLGIHYTEGVKYLAENAGAYWLIDAVASYRTHKAFRAEPFQLWELKRKGNGATLTMRRDSGEPALITQDIEFTDFPLQEIKLYVCDRVLLLPSEY